MDEQRRFYPTSAELEKMGQSLSRDVNLCSEELRAWFGTARVQVRTQAEKPAPHGHFGHTRGGKRIA